MEGFAVKGQSGDLARILSAQPWHPAEINLLVGFQGLLPFGRRRERLFMEPLAGPSPVRISCFGMEYEKPLVMGCRSRLEAMR